jgi:hypothetical protein
MNGAGIYSLTIHPLIERPNSKFRVRVTPARRGRGRKRRQPAGESWLDKTPAERHASMTCTPRA